MTTTRLSTAEVGAGAEFDFWADAISSTFVPLDCAPTADGAFHAELVSTRAADVGFTQVTAAPHRVDRTFGLHHDLLYRPIQTPLVRVNSSMLAGPSSRPDPLAPNPPCTAAGSSRGSMLT
jgi:hypothetical protein